MDQSPFQPGKPVKPAPRPPEPQDAVSILRRIEANTATAKTCLLVMLFCLIGFFTLSVVGLIFVVLAGAMAAAR